ncbi:MAG: hypothetical protein AB3N14_06255 [Flavobacteriaceae bacterium]
MSCCGEKRKMFFRRKGSDSQAKKSQAANDPSLPVEEFPEKIFEYVGSTSLIVKGNATGRTYHFRFPGHLLRVSHTDSFALFAESDLKFVS